MEDQPHVFSGLGEALRWLRTRRRLLQGEVAERAGVTSSQLSSYERGRMLPNLLTLSRIVKALDCDLQDLTDAVGLVQGSAPAAGAGHVWPPGRTSASETDLLARVSRELLGLLLDRSSPAAAYAEKLLGLPAAGTTAERARSEPAPRARRAGRR